MEVLTSIPELLRDPGPEFSPIPFWFLNDELTSDEIRRQLRDFRKHGVYGVVLHPRMGIPDSIGYLSDRFFDAIGAALETCRELGMTAVLYDEGMYPSGSACGQVVRGHPELASLGITMTDSPLPGEEILARENGRCLVVRHTGGTIRGVHFGQDDGEANAPPSADILNPEAVARFIGLTHEAYYSRFREYFGTTVTGFFTDEPNILGRCVRGFEPWTRGFTDIFKAAGGDPAGLTALFRGEENRDTRLYRELIIKRENRVYYGALSSWCRDHGISLMGHPDRSDDIEREVSFHIPGQDLVYRQVAPETGDLTGADSTQAKCAADAAWLLGRRRCLSECLGVCGGERNPWSMTGGDVKWFLDYLAVRGVNMYVPHAFYYSLTGPRKDERPPDVGPHSIWWPRYELWSRYIRRLSCLMTDAALRAPVAVLVRNRELVPERVAPLFRRQIGFRYIPESFWPKCRERDGRLVCGDTEFEAVIGPEGLFPSVSRDTLVCEPDIVCAQPQTELRTARFVRSGTDCVLLVNAGESGIETEVTLPFDRAGEYDLWTGETYRFSGRLSLPRRGSLLLFRCGQVEYRSLRQRPESVRVPAPEFELVGEADDYPRRIYRATLDADGRLLSNASLLMEVDAEEMAELTVNGEDAGVSFWRPHVFELAPFLRSGRNELVLTVTGSPANLYGKPVPYGMNIDSK